MNKRISFYIVACLVTIALVGCTKVEGNTKEKAQSVKQEEKAEEVKPESRGIKGTHYIDPRLGLEERGFPKKSLEDLESRKCKIYENTRKDDSTGIQYNCSLCIEDDNTIISATFEVLNLEEIEIGRFISNATNYLKYCGSIPYDTSNVDKVYSWIDENIEQVGSGEKGATIVIGDAEFNLYGTQLPSGIPGSRTIEIQKATKTK
ncbi:hypothetical protein DP124_12040 [Clostridium tetani]|uniref:hypothetical protein n=1 Tax=Clostridium tetani TaxID=1513 RepID=UPI00100A3519|nr:hypothetical protein [Clostridium tetani]RXI50193.1 hypothetical protein DP124_12040 [Clostridium tetani]